MCNATIVALAFGSKNARGALFEDHTTVGRTLGNEDVCSYNVLTTNEVAMIILSEPGEVGNHDVIV
jgi:glycine cleavage system pyridoxal-binding protein P